jgi:hypothetical protein
VAASKIISGVLSEASLPSVIIATTAFHNSRRSYRP